MSHIFTSQMDTSWLLLGILFLLSLLWIWTKTRRTYTKYNIPPFPVRPWPIFGHFFLFIGNFRKKIYQWRQTAGNIYSIDLAGTHVIFVNGFDAIKEVLVKNAESIPNVQRNIASNILNEFDRGIIGGRDDNWKEQRTTTLAILRSFGVGRNIMAESIQGEVAVFTNKLASLNGKPTDIRLLTNISVSNVICAIIVGQRFEYEDPYFVSFMGHLNNILQYQPALRFVGAFPFLWYLPGDPLNVKKWKNSVQVTNETFSKAYIKLFKKNLKDEPKNFITAYLQEVKKRQENGEPSKLDELNLIAIIRTLFIAGTETTSTTILWCLVFTLHHPYVQEKIYQEIKANVGFDRVPNMADKSKLTYLNAVIMETQRFASLAPLAFRREIKETFQVQGFTFPKGSSIWPVLDSVHFDKEIWGDPENFRPERFIDKDGTLLHPEELIPFSIGRRACLGESLARMELFLFLSTLFQKFKFEPYEQLPSLTGVVGATVIPKPFKIRCIEQRV